LIPPSSASTIHYSLFQIHGFRVQFEDPFDDAENSIAATELPAAYYVWK
jgi:hypothetical protein